MAIVLFAFGLLLGKAQWYGMGCEEVSWNWVLGVLLWGLMPEVRKIRAELEKYFWSGIARYLEPRYIEVMGIDVVTLT